MKLAIAACLVAAFAIQFERDRLFAASRSEAAESVLYLQSGKTAEKLALSFDDVMADVYWIRALQYFGNARLHGSTEHRYDQLYSLLDLTTSLDPRFNIAYRFGAVFLAEPYPGGAGRPDLAIALLKKGVAETDRWEYCHDIGFVYYWHLHDYGHAAEWFQKGSELPGAPWWMKTYAGIMLARGGNRSASRFLWRNIYATSDQPFLKAAAERRLRQLDALDQLDTLTRIVSAYHARTGSWPNTWQQLVAARALPGIPVDPTGQPYVLIPFIGEVRLSTDSSLSPLPTDTIPDPPSVPAQ